MQREFENNFQYLQTLQCINFASQDGALATVARCRSRKSVHGLYTNSPHPPFSHSVCGGSGDETGIVTSLRLRGGYYRPVPLYLHVDHWEGLYTRQLRNMLVSRASPHSTQAKDHDISADVSLFIPL